jgi:hypothetical protein
VSEHDVKPIKDVARIQLPVNQRTLLVALGKFLRGHTEATLPASEHLGRGPAAFVLYAMSLHLIKLGRVLQDLCSEGHTIEARLIGRAMVSAALGILLIAEQDSDARALLFASFEGTVRRQRAAALVKHGYLTQARADELEAEHAAEDVNAFSVQAAAGTVPAARLGKRPEGWSGLSDYALAQRFQKSSWYDLFYGPMSDQTHVNTVAIQQEISELLAGKIMIGATFGNPFLVVMAACDTVSHASESLDQFFSIGSAIMRAALDDEMKRAVAAFVAG